MSEIKLEVGQVWKSGEYEVSIKDVYESCNNKVIAYRRTVLNTSILDSMHHPEETFRKYYQTLITNADGTPHVKPNDYQAGDVWEGTFNETIIQYFIYRHNLTLCYICGSGASGPLSMVNNFFAGAQDYKLIHREGE